MTLRLDVPLARLVMSPQPAALDAMASDAGPGNAAFDFVSADGVGPGHFSVPAGTPIATIEANSGGGAQTAKGPTSPTLTNKEQPSAPAPAGQPEAGNSSAGGLDDATRQLLVMTGLDDATIDEAAASPEGLALLNKAADEAAQRMVAHQPATTWGSSVPAGQAPQGVAYPGQPAVPPNPYQTSPQAVHPQAAPAPALPNDLAALFAPPSPQAVEALTDAVGKDAAALILRQQQQAQAAIAYAQQVQQAADSRVVALQQAILNRQLDTLGDATLGDSNKRLTPAQVRSRNELLNIADNVYMQSRARGVPMSDNEAIQTAHAILSRTTGSGAASVRSVQQFAASRRASAVSGTAVKFGARGTGLDRAPVRDEAAGLALLQAKLDQYRNGGN